MFLIARALGIGRPAERNRASNHPQGRYLFRSVHVIRWRERFRFGYVLGWDGPYWHNAIGVRGTDWNNGNWLGGSSWRRGWGPVAVCRWRRRGSMVSDIQFERNMGCSCMHLAWRWIRGNGTVAHQTLCARVNGAEENC